MKPFHCTLLTGLLLACASADAERAVRGAAFATAGDTELKLDLFLPDEDAPAGLIVWVHGVARRGDSRESADFKIMHGSAHGGPAFTDDANLARIDGFLRSHLPRDSHAFITLFLVIARGSRLGGTTVAIQLEFQMDCLVSGRCRILAMTDRV